MIGKYSSLACSNTVYITSYYEGKAYYYVMVKSGNSITTNLISEKSTVEKNGVEVTIKNIYKIEPYFKALQCITFFPNVYIDGANTNFNDIKIKRFNNFAAASDTITSKLLLGNVLYPINYSLLNVESSDFLFSIRNTGIVVKFNVGELNITPNRESIIYNSDTIEKINNRIAAAKKELEDLVILKIAKDYNDFQEYYKNISNYIYYDPVTDSIKNYYGYKVYPDKLSNVSITYNGHDLREDIGSLKSIVKMTLPNFKGIIYDNKILKGGCYLSREITVNSELLADKLIILNKGARFTSYAKAYFRENYNEYGVITDMSRSEFSDWIKHNDPLSIGVCKNPDIIIDAIYKSLTSKAIKINLDTDKGFLEYKARLSTNNISVRDLKQTILYRFTSSGYKDKVVFKRFSQAVDYIKELKSGVILTNMDGNDLIFSTLAKLKGYIYIKARKDIVEDLRSLNLKCLVNIDWLINKDPILSIVKTMIKYIPVIDSSEVKELCLNLDGSISSEFLRLLDIHYKFGENATYRVLAIKDSIPYDSYTKYLCLKLKDYLIKHREAKNLAHTVGCHSSVLTNAVIIKTKAYRINNEAYNKVKNNKLLNVLCRK